jgi:hypothetical protein
METKPRSVFMNSISYGLMTGAASIGFAIIMYVADIEQQSPIAYLGFLILIGGMVYGTIQYKTKVGGGYMSYSQAFVSGLLIAIIASLVSAIYSYLFYSFFDPAAHAKIVETAMEKSQEKMAGKGMTDEQMESALNISRKFMSPAAMSFFTLFGGALAGAILSLLAAIFIKKVDTSFEGQFKEN